MGKLLCEATTTQPWRDPQPTVDPTTTVNSSWDDVAGLEDQQRKTLARVHAKGVLWKHPEDSTTYPPSIFQLNHGGEVDADGNCLFSAACIASASGCDPKELRKRTVKRFEKDFSEGSEEEKEKVEKIIKNMYHPDLTNGWGIHVVQDVKLLANKSDRCHFDLAITQLVNLGMQRESAAESIYKERCIAVNNGPSWAKYMSVSGSPDDEYDIITLQYTEEGLLTVDENREGHAAAFGDDIAIECLATEFEREIFVVQAHGSDAMVDEDHCVFFLPHRPRCQITRPPIFLFMKGTGWCGAGADHYEPLIANPCPLLSQEKVAFVL